MRIESEPARRPVLTICASVLALVLSACQPGEAPQPGRTEATAVEERTVALGGRLLVLDGFAGDVRVEVDSAATGVHVRLVRRASGATQASARERLARVTVETGGDDEIYQVVWRANSPGGAMEPDDGLRADAVATVPPGTPVVVRTLRGGVAVDGPTGDLDVGVGAGEIVVGRASALRLRLDARTGDITLAAAGIPPGAEWTVETLAGTIDLSLSSGTNVDLDASTDAGRIVDRGLDADSPGATGQTERRITLGRGGARLRAHTAAGTVTLGQPTDIDDTETGQVD